MRSEIIYFQQKGIIKHDITNLTNTTSFNINKMKITKKRNSIINVFWNLDIFRQMIENTCSILASVFLTITLGETLSYSKNKMHLIT